MTEDRGKKGIIAGIKRDWPAVALILASLVTGVLVYPHLPEMVPSHWNVRGEVDGYSSKFWGAFGLPLMNAGIYLLMVLAPGFDPRRENYVRFQRAYWYMKLSLVVFFTWLYAVILANSTGYSIPVDKSVITAVGVLFIIIGNFMGQLRHNYFVGIKIPWTLASEEVWRKTHRFASWLWVLSGLVMVFAGLLLGGRRGLVVVIAAVGGAVFVPALYAYLLYRRTHPGHHSQ